MEEWPFQESSQELVYPFLISQKHWFETKEKNLTKLFDIGDPPGNCLKFKMVFRVVLVKYLSARILIWNALGLDRNL